MPVDYGGIMKRVLCLVLAVMLLLPSAFADGENNELTGYSKKDGYCYVTFGSYPYEADGTEAPIFWRVLEVQDDRAYLLSEYIVDFFYTAYDSKAYYKAKDWRESSLYTYLQEDFAGIAFSENEKAVLLEDSTDGSYVAVLHKDEARSAAYGLGENRDRRCAGTPYAKNKSFTVDWGNKKRSYTLYRYKDGNSPWYLREKSSSPSMQLEILNEGKIGKVGCTNADVGIRPCVWIDTENIIIASGSGTKDDPFVLKTIQAEEQADVPGEVTVDTVITDGDEVPEEKTEETPVPENTENAALVNDTVVSASDTSGTQEDGDTDKNESAADDRTHPAADPENIHPLFPELNSEGFLPENEPEFVLEDPDNGIWLYCSQTLRIQIIRQSGKNSKNKPLIWYEADIYTREGGEVFDLYAYNEEKYTNIYERALPQDMAKQHKLVFAVNSDYFIYRVERDKEEKTYNYPVGSEIRNGKILYTQTRGTKSYTYPPLDVLALYPDGDMRVFANTLLYTSNYKTASVEFEGKTYEFAYKKGDKLNARLQAEQAVADMILATGASDTLCFGPILISDGKKADTSAWGTSENPRTAIGMVEKGHYVCIVADGRKPNVSEGVNCIWIMDRMYDKGCTLAFNLDGGATSAMMFMGKQISVAGNYANGLTKRGQNELLGIGVSDLVE